ncbi:MAG: DUF507 family protein [Deltaproteobacteria bacterium]|nr:DUF507 family protein [Deltaproteobacteria bacterium]
MKLYAGKVSVISAEIVKNLVDDHDIDTSNPAEVELDVAAILNEYLKRERQIAEKAKDIMEKRGLPYAQFGKIKRGVAEEEGFAMREDGISWMCNQILDFFMHQSKFVDEIYADDHVMRKKMKEIFRKHMMLDEELDREVRERIQNLEEGSVAWDVEYKKVMEQIRHKHGIDR